MLQNRVIPTLLLSKGRLVKTQRFENATYVGDPINAVRIFNDKEVDEIVFLDIDATVSGSGPNFSLLADIASEAFMPFGYGGGITSVDQVERLLSLGVEKVILNSAAVSDPGLVRRSAAVAGSSSVVVSIDARRQPGGTYGAYINSGRVDTGRPVLEVAREMERLGAGEILLQSIDREGTRDGYDLDLIRIVSSALSIPVVASGGAGTTRHLREAVDAGASAVAAGSFFVFQGRHRAVLITYPEYEELRELFER